MHPYGEGYFWREIESARSAMFYLVDMIMFAEANRPQRDDVITAPMTVPDHAWIRGKYD